MRLLTVELRDSVVLTPDFRQSEADALHGKTPIDAPARTTVPFLTHHRHDHVTDAIPAGTPPTALVKGHPPPEKKPQQNGEEHTSNPLT